MIYLVHIYFKSQTMLKRGNIKKGRKTNSKYDVCYVFLRTFKPLLKG